MPDRRLQLYVAVVALTGAIAGACTVAGLTGPALHVDEAVIALALATLCAELFPVLIVRRGGSEEIDVSTAFTLAALLTAGPAAAVALQAVSRSAVELASGRPLIKQVFNVGQRVLTVAAAGAAVALLGAHPLLDGDGIRPAGAVAFVAAATTYIAVNGLLVTVVCALAAGEPVRAFVRRELLRTGVDEVFQALLAPVAAALVLADPLLVPLLAVPAWALRRSGRQGAASYHQSRHDTLTGLPNRVRLREHLDDRFGEVDRTRRRFGFVIADLNRFKEVNDTLGRAQGDRLLAAVAGRMADVVGDGGVLGRLQGTDFGILVEGDVTDALDMARRLVSAFHMPLDVGDLSLEVGVSAGVAVTTADVEHTDELLRRADVALSSAKTSGVGFAAYVPERDHFSRRRLALIGDLRRAIANGEVQPFFQPQVDLRSGAVVGAEALARWRRPDGTYVQPAEFVRDAERSGVIKPLTLHVLDAALDARRAWAASGVDVRMAVNLSARSLLNPELTSDVERALERAGADPAALELEVTETAIMTDPERARRTLERLHAVGVHLAIDDFGTGYSSLAYLGRLPVDAVKIDRSFIRRLDADAAAEVIVRMTIGLGHDLGLTVVAEGIEDEAARDRLRALGCDTAQGFLWSPAVPQARFPATVAELAAGRALPA